MGGRLEPRRVLLVTKTSLFENVGSRSSARRLAQMIREGHPMVAKVRSSHEETVRARERVRSVLASRGVRVTAARRYRPVPAGTYDLVVVVGGDGTVLDVARFIRDTPVLAVNSSPSTSVGHFCRCTAEGLENELDNLADGVLSSTPLARIRSIIDREEYKYPALNDVLLAHRVPAATSRYTIRVGEIEEEHKSSGVWISTAAGSTGAILSAGGEVMDLSDRRLQYLVREPFTQAVPGGSTYRLVRGMVGDEGLSFTSRMLDGALYLDGRRVAVPLEYGSTVIFRPDAPPLNIFLPDDGRIAAGPAPGG